jgi:hypothetical protein
LIFNLLYLLATKTPGTIAVLDDEKPNGIAKTTHLSVKEGIVQSHKTPYQGDVPKILGQVVGTDAAWRGWDLGEDH